ncbi:uncharacterized protein LOC113790151 [Dermatophagoides pteronyssinus]|uniref:Serine/threonine-protein kinase phg2-like n=2 Tax=Dermatophagoides pteronyssinus TaxID=6956 RepID=A0A6P6XRZ2_DERPT|nr:serine/threonine-protein kinase phg2-like [Dermatophagoides pteronyssinus]XP_027195578.1 serine/threonine-protein kinase phg2-like [Dermatophagoides pteronyssinus]XP_027195579.1 serine/threonine-protein kinase phg2-like [Dermatophagoides pteronyssinus]KAH9419325.1 protein with role in RNA processing [Dermatophagoides pteronyssinus]
MTTILPTELISNKKLLVLNIGDIVECRTCFEEIFTGEVMAFDYENQNKILVLKIPSTSSSSTCNITCVNLEFCSNVHVVQEMPESTSNTHINLPDINTNKLEERVNVAVKERNNLIEAYKSGVSSDGISLYLSLIKTIGGSVTLESFHNNKEHCIVIKKNTKITPPFSADCVQAVVLPNKTAGPMASEAVKYARQLVEKFWRDQNKDPYTLASCGPSSTQFNVKNQNNNDTTTTSNNNNLNNSRNNSNNSSKESSPHSTMATLSSPTTSLSSQSGSRSSPVPPTTTAVTAQTSTINNMISTTKTLINNLTSSIGNVQTPQNSTTTSSSLSSSTSSSSSSAASSTSNSATMTAAAAVSSKQNQKTTANSRY